MITAIALAGLASTLAIALPRDEALETLDARVEEIVKSRPAGALAVAGLLSRAFATQLGIEDPYAVATYSFEHATRDDVALASNDWDVQYGNPNDTISVQMIVDDRSRIFDLGAVDFATAPNAAASATGGEKPIDARQGHVYVVHTVDLDTDLWSRFRVLEVEKEKWIVFEWQTRLEPSPELRRLERTILPDLTSGTVRLEVRSASGGGNPYGVFLDGTATTSVDAAALAPVSTKESPRHTASAFCDGGLIPEGHVFVVESIEWSASLDDGATGPLAFEFWLGPYRVAAGEEGRVHTIDVGASAESGTTSKGKFAGTVVILPGEESRVAAVAKNGTVAGATLRGRLVSAREKKLPPLPIALSKRAAREANDFLRRIDEGEFDDAPPATSQTRKGAAEKDAFLEDVLRFRTSAGERARIERALKRDRRP